MERTERQNYSLARDAGFAGRGESLNLIFSKAGKLITADAGAAKAP